MNKVSVVIPCYNQGQYIQEAIDSVLNQTYQNYEIIVVNDGSTDQKTNDIISQLKHEKISVINTKNQGLAAARNNGVSAATGEYILPLDADDKIDEKYLELAVNILDENTKIGIVYCEAQLFGLRNEKWELSEYSYERILINNVIFCSALYRKKDWQKVGGYNHQMIYGWEDWNFWLSLLSQNNLQVYKIPQILFFYRIKEKSMSTMHHLESKKVIQSFFTNLFHHSNLYSQNFEALYISIKDFFARTKPPVIFNTIILKNENENYIVDKITPLNNGQFKTEFSFTTYQVTNYIVYKPTQYQYCRLKITEISLKKKNVEKVYNWENIKNLIQTNGAIDEHHWIIFSTKHPQITLPFTGEIKSLKIAGEIEILDSDSIINEKNNEINALKKETAFLQSSKKDLMKKILWKIIYYLKSIKPPI